MNLTKKLKDKKIDFEFNKEYINVLTDKISNNDAIFITDSFKEMHPADAADIIDYHRGVVGAVHWYGDGSRGAGFRRTGFSGTANSKRGGAHIAGRDRPIARE